MNKSADTCLKSRFVSYFSSSCSHTEVSPSNILRSQEVDGDSTFYTPAGMAQFESCFRGDTTPIADNVITVQPVVRVGGKHNDISNIGISPRHHTMFTMLGNFSFGGYGRKTAIWLAWYFLIVELGIPPNKLIVTVHRDDKETLDVWKEVHTVNSSSIKCLDRNIVKPGTFLTKVKSRNIRLLGDEDNYWSMGETGLCGMSTEIFYNLGRRAPLSSRFLEIWNLVFISHDVDEFGVKHKLAKLGVDTGMGLERVNAVLEGVVDTYSTIEFKKLLHKVSELLKVPITGVNKVQYKVIVDHSRTVSAIIGRVLPSNVGQGYVVRKLLRKIFMSVTSILGIIIDRWISEEQESELSLCCEVFKAIDYETYNNHHRILKKELSKFISVVNRTHRLLEIEYDKGTIIDKVISKDRSHYLKDTHGVYPDVLKIFGVKTNDDH